MDNLFNDVRPLDFKELNGKAVTLGYVVGDGIGLLYAVDSTSDTMYILYENHME